ERREPVHRVARADADDALGGLDTDEGGGERAARDRVPGGGERRVEGQLEPGDADVGDLHVTWVGSKWALDGASAAARTSSSAGRASAPAASAARVASRLWRYTAPARSGVAPGSTQTAAMSRRSSTSWAGTTPSRTASATPAATPAWAGPHVREACTSPSTVALLTNTVAGLAATLGRTQATKGTWPGRGVASAVAHAASTGPPLAPSTVLTWAAAGPSPTKASPTWVARAGAADGAGPV